MKKVLIFILTAVFACSCIDNDLPYPVVVPHLTSLSVDGATSVEISYDNRVVTVTMPETQDLRKVVIRNYEIDSEIARTSIQLKGVHDLSNPLSFKITTYDDYTWTIKAVRPIERYFTVVGQVGSTVIDETNCRAVAMVGKSVSLSSITVSSLKLGPKDITTYSAEPESLHDFTDGIELSVTAFGITEEWHLFVENTDASVEINDINPWTREVYVTFTGVAGQENGFAYRESGTSQWIALDDSAITADGGTFVAHIKELKAETEYEVYAYSGSESTSVETFVTAPATPLPNHSFENFSIVTGKDYYKWFNPYASDEDSREMFWGTGNGEGPDGVNGTASLGIVLTYPDSNAPDGQYCVRCESKSFAGMLACGNIFTGQFAGLVGTTGGKVHYGRPWSTRPKALRFKMKYNSGIVDIVGSYPPGDVVKVGDNDRCHIIATVGDWDYHQYGGSKNSPVLVNTAEGVYFSKESAGIIGYGEYILAESTDGWIEMEIPIEYRSLTRKPTHIIVICAASIRGDYLTGSSRSTLWVDDFDLVY